MTLFHNISSAIDPLATSSPFNPSHRRLSFLQGAAAETIGRSCAYVGAGTVEFLVDSARNFYFLEVNTRLQVEHPITELVRGLDLVALQLHIAAGRTLRELGVTVDTLAAPPASPLAASVRIPKAAHAVECRLYAEDPWNNFFPSTGSLLVFHSPALPGVRFDSGVESGGDVSVFYDPLLAKVITWGADRAEAIRRMVLALGNTIVAGVTTNRLFLIHALQHPQVRYSFCVLLLRSQTGYWIYCSFVTVCWCGDYAPLPSPSVRILLTIPHPSVSFPILAHIFPRPPHPPSFSSSKAPTTQPSFPPSCRRPRAPSSSSTR